MEMLEPQEVVTEEQLKRIAEVYGEMEAVRVEIRSEQCLVCRRTIYDPDCIQLCKDCERKEGRAW